MKYKDMIRELPEPEGKDTWSVHRKNFRNEMLGSNDWNKFRTWPTVQATIYSGTRTPNVHAQIELCKGSAWCDTALSFTDYNNGTVIHQAYSLWLYEKVTGRSLDENDRYLEFGGGYGEMARLVYLVSTPLSYLVYDLPEVAVLQQWYFDTHIGTQNGPIATSDMEVAKSYENPTILASICAISEAPPETKVEFLEGCPAESLLLRYQPMWDKFNNKALFTEFAEANYHNVHQEFAPEFNNHSYLIAWDRK